MKKLITLIAALHQPHDSLSFDREYTSISIPSTNAPWPGLSNGGSRTLLKRNFDSSCQLKLN